MNRKYVSFDGYFEVVYSYDNNLLNESTDSEDMGTYNFAPFNRGGNVFNSYISHYLKDVIPFNSWLNDYKDIENTF